MITNVWNNNNGVKQVWEYGSVGEVISFTFK
jgi:hypothetical protein